MPEWLNDNEWAIWLGVALVLGVVEAATVDLVFLMLAAGAVAASVASLAGLGYVAQVLIAVAVAAALLVGVRPLAKRRLQGAQDIDAIGTARYVGLTGLATQDISDTAGLARVEGEVWSSRVDDGESTIPAGHEVRVALVRGATLVVTPVPPVRDIITRGK